MPETPVGLRAAARAVLVVLWPLRLLAVGRKEARKVRPPLLAVLDLLGGASPLVLRIGLSLDVEVQLAPRLPDF